MQGEFTTTKTDRLLEKLRVEFTKSRPRQTNDNALAECKNRAVIRKTMGYYPKGYKSHIPQKHAAAINHFYSEALNPYLNFHGPRPPGRPCYFAVDTMDAKGKIKKTYPHDQLMTPWERLKSIPNHDTYLKLNVTAQSLDHEAHSMAIMTLQRKCNPLENNYFFPLTVDPNPLHDNFRFSLILGLENTPPLSQILNEQGVPWHLLNCGAIKRRSITYFRDN